MDTPEKIEADAALWVMRLERELTASEQDEFLQWYMSDTRHPRELDRQMANWKRLNVLADWRPEHTAHPNRDLLAPRLAQGKSATPGRPWYLSVEAGLAAAAALILGL